MRRTPMKALAAALLVVACTVVGFAPNAATQTGENCPPLYNGRWTGEWASLDRPDLKGTLIADIDFDGDQIDGLMRVFGSVVAEGRFTGTVICNTFTATFDSANSHITVDHAGTISDDGRSIESAYAHDEGGPEEDHGVFTIEVQAEEGSAAVGDTVIWEGGTEEPTAFAAAAKTKAKAAPKPKPRTASLAVTLADPATARTVVQWSIIGGTAVPGVDYVVPKPAKQKAVIPKGKTQAFIDIDVLPNGVRENDRTIEVAISVPGSVPWDSTGVITIRDDD